MDVMVPVAAAAATLWLDVMPLDGVSQEWGQPRAGRSVDDHPLTLGGTVFEHGIGTHAASDWTIDLKGAAEAFAATVGVDDERRGQGSVVFTVRVDGRPAWESGVMRGGDPPKRVVVPVAVANRLRLMVSDAGDGIGHDHADWAGARLLLSPGAKERPVPFSPSPEPPPPIARGTPPEPAIHGPRVVGTTPGRPFLFRVPATGERPVEFTASGLPPGLALDARTGIVTGSVPTAGTWTATVTADGPRGRGQRTLTIVAGERKLALTPPLGWNSWNAWGCAVDQGKVRAAAEAMVASGLADHGFAYVNVDDCWEGGRGKDGAIRPNDKFRRMRELAASIHALGLKLGIYSSPGPKTCGGYEGSFGHEARDAGTYAAWGIDYLKYDWCSYGEVAKGETREELARPYRLMRDALDRCGRDIVFSFCQYGMGNVWEWGAEAGGNLWRTTGDITDAWTSLAGIAFKQPDVARYAGPGRWNDPDMLVVGKVGWGPNLHPTRLTPAEQVTHLTAWCLLAAPLLVGCDLAQVDDWTLALLTNDEVLDVDQDELGKAATRVAREDEHEVWARPLVDGSTAVGLFNRGPDRADVAARWSDLHLAGTLPVRDLWQRKDLGRFEGSFAASVPAHGAVLLKVGGGSPGG